MNSTSSLHNRQVSLPMAPVVPLTTVSQSVEESEVKSRQEDSLIVYDVHSSIRQRSGSYNFMSESAYYFNHGPELTVKMLLKGSLYDAWAATAGTVIWMAIFYIPLRELGLTGYIAKNLAMGFFPNYFTKGAFRRGCLARGATENQAEQRADNYVKIIGPLDSLFQVQLDTIRYVETGVFVFFSDNVFSSQEMLLHLAFTLGGFSLLFHILTYIVEPEELNTKESAKIGPQYYALYAADSVINMLSVMLLVSDMALDLTAAPVVTGIATLIVNFSLDLLQLYYERRKYARELAEMRGPDIEIVDDELEAVDLDVQQQESSQSRRPGCGDILFGFVKASCCFFRSPARQAAVALSSVSLSVSASAVSR